MLNNVDRTPEMPQKENPDSLCSRRDSLEICNIRKSDFICRATPYGTRATKTLSCIPAARLGEAACRLKVGEEVMIQSDRYTAKELCVNASLT